VTAGGAPMIWLSGPGGAGKTTTGAALAPMLAIPFHDLDQLFSERHGNIGAFIETEGYNAYAYANIERCRERFQRYMDLPGEKVSTMRPVEAVAADIIRRMAL
jgi:shikimate kinase